jgi:GNAT superfamily N-acetyltransferase
MSIPARITESGIAVRPMQESDLVKARSIFRQAFGTFIGLPNPEAFGADQEYIFTRWRFNPDAALAADVNSELAGSNFVTNWGSFGFFGPLTIRPDLWDRHIGTALLSRTMDLMEKAGMREAGLFTFAHSPKHVGLYQKFGFWPRFLTAVMSKEANTPGISLARYSGYSTLTGSHQTEARTACRELTNSLYDGLDVTSEIRSVSDQNLGETVLLWGGDSLEAFAVCHCGAGTEAGEDTCYLKFAAVGPGPGAEKSFDRLFDACEALAIARNLRRMQAGVNLARSQAYRQMLRRGFRTQFQGVAMHKPDTAAYNRPDAYILDDWR